MIIYTCFLSPEMPLRPYQFDFMLLGQKWLADEVGLKIKMIVM